MLGAGFDQVKHGVGGVPGERATSAKHRERTDLARLGRLNSLVLRWKCKKARNGEMSYILENYSVTSARGPDWGSEELGSGSRGRVLGKSLQP